MHNDQLFKLSGADDVKVAGGKALALGEMLRSGFNVPNGFVLPVSVFNKMTPALEDVLLNAFDELGAKFVAVRSSAINEDGQGAAWAGQLETFLNCTRQDLIQKVQDCWESTSSPRAQSYAAQKGIMATKVAVIVQEMIDSEISGVAFSMHPVTNSARQIVIEAGLGLGEAVVSGQITPDTYIVDKKDDTLLEKHLASQKRMLVRGVSGGNIWEDTGLRGASQKLTADQIIELSKLTKKLEDFFQYPVDVEWAIKNGLICILQCRPITT